MKNIWYAVQIDSTDAWDYGSHDYDEAVEMLIQQGRGQIAIINENTGFCEGETNFKEAVDGRVERNKAMKIRINGNTYTELYSFDGGTYFTPDNAEGAEPWVAVMNDGSVKLLINGKHIDTEYAYEIV